MKRFAILIIFLSVFLMGCSAHHQTVQHVGTKYAKLFSVEKYSNYVVLRDSEGRKIVLYSKEKPDVKADLFIKTPVKRVVVFSTTHVSYLEALGVSNTIVGVPSVAKWYFKDIAEGLKSGRIKSIGDPRNPNYEVILSLKPDVVFVDAKFVGPEVLKKLDALKVPYVCCDFWLEKNPLGRLEWIKFFGYFFNKEKQATEYFNKVENKVLSIEKEVRGLKRPKVVYALIFRGMVLVPGGENYHAKVVEMAGGDYVFKNLNSSKYVTISSEELIDKTANADVYIAIYMGTPINSTKDLIKQIPGLAKTKPFETGRVYAMQPWIWQYACSLDKVVGDLAAIFHPSKFPNHKLVMFKKLT